MYQLRKTAILALLGGVPAVAASASATTMVLPNVQVFVSHDSEWLVRIETRPSFSNASTATAHWHRVDGTGEYRRKVSAPLRNRRAPMLGYLTNTGTLVTIGDWDDERNLMLAVYASDGKLRQSWSMIDMFSSDYMACLLRKADAERDGGSLGSLYWLAKFEQFMEDQDSVWIRDRLFGQIQVDTRTGAIKLLEGPCEQPLGAMTWDLGETPRWKPSRHEPSVNQGTAYLLKIFGQPELKWQLEQIEYATTEGSTFDGLAQMLPVDARVTGRGEALGLPVLYSEYFEEVDNIRHVSAVSGDKTRALRLSISWRPVKGKDETAAATAELKTLIAGMKRVEKPGKNQVSAQ